MCPAGERDREGVAQTASLINVPVARRNNMHDRRRSGPDRAPRRTARCWGQQHFSTSRRSRKAGRAPGTLLRARYIAAPPDNLHCGTRAGIDGLTSLSLGTGEENERHDCAKRKRRCEGTSRSRQRSIGSERQAEQEGIYPASPEYPWNGVGNRRRNCSLDQEGYAAAPKAVVATPAHARPSIGRSE